MSANQTSRTARTTDEASRRASAHHTNLKARRPASSSAPPNKAKQEAAPRLFRLGHGTPRMLEPLLRELGWQSWDAKIHDMSAWTLTWKASRFTEHDIATCLPHQRLNHFPGTTAITKKDSLVRVMRRMRRLRPKLYNFVPKAFLFPSERAQLQAHVEKTSTRNKERDGDGQGARGAFHCPDYICKPADSSRGRGISLARDPLEENLDGAYVIQQYIARPLTVGGYKTDLRLYVLATSFRPMCIYKYDQGLARFATTKYDASGDGDSLLAHLTNTSLNKHADASKQDKEGVGAGCKWTLSKFRTWLGENYGERATAVWPRIDAIILLTLLPLVREVQSPSSPNCFELFGFDIMLDQDLRPWLLEVNYCPALTLDCDEDDIVKKPLVKDLLQLLFHDADGRKPSARAPPSARARSQRAWPEQVGGWTRLLPFDAESSRLTTSSRVDLGVVADYISDHKAK